MQMKQFVRWFAVFLVLSSLAYGDDLQKAKKELNRITAMANDGMGRTVVNLSMAETFKVKRPDLVMERRNTGLNYGSLFVARTLMVDGMKKEEIVAELKAGKDIYQIANAKQADWKKITADAKKFNYSVDDNLYK